MYLFDFDAINEAVLNALVLRNMTKKFLKSQTIILSAEFPIIKMYWR